MGSERDGVLDVACAVIADRSGRFFACRRAPHLRDGGRWEFPGGKLEAGETAEACVRRELREELGVEAFAAAAIAVVESSTSSGRIRLHACPTVLDSAPVGSSDHDGFMYVTLDEFLALPVTPAEEALLRELRRLSDFHSP